MKTPQHTRQTQGRATSGKPTEAVKPSVPRMDGGIDPKCLRAECGLHHSRLLDCRRAQRMHASGHLPQPELNYIPAPILAAGVAIMKIDIESAVLTKALTETVMSVNKDRHSPGYMKAYMAKRRAAQRGA